MFEAEINEAKYYIENFLEPHKKSAEAIKSKELKPFKHVLIDKITKLESILDEIISALKMDSELEEFEDFNNSDQKKSLNKLISDLSRTVSNLIGVHQNSEMILVENIDNWTGDFSNNRKQLMNTERNEIDLFKFFEELLIKADRILKKHKTGFVKEKTKIKELRKKLHQIYNNFQKVIEENNMEFELIGALN